MKMKYNGSGVGEEKCENVKWMEWGIEWNEGWRRD